jgi:hypothetical protein
MIEALRKIAAELVALVQDASDEHPIDPSSVKLQATRLAAQIEMAERDLHDN